jgi:hypothetical protein
MACIGWSSGGADALYSVSLDQEHGEYPEELIPWGQKLLQASCTVEFRIHNSPRKNMHLETNASTKIFLKMSRSRNIGR